MYISSTVIAVVLAMAFYYFYNENKKTTKRSSIDTLPSQDFSYKLDIYIEPNWFAIYKKISRSESDEQAHALIEKAEAKSKDVFSDLWGRRYRFTEYYDAASGLLMRFQNTTYRDGTQRYTSVDEFGDRGYVFDSDSRSSNRRDESKEEMSRRQELSIEVGEDFIRNDIFDKYIGGRRYDYEKENYLLSLPLSDIFQFRYAIGQKFSGLEMETVVKWPEKIERIFEERKIKYELYTDYDPKLFDIEKEDAALFEKWGKPKITSYGGDGHSSFLSDNYGNHFGVRLEMFRKGDNERLPFTD
ncbi:MAG TPA: hypothetical protein PLR08_01765 [bacterium]|nr:hypothetical protein [Candidatus Magasanikbacteria bacterium]HPF95258.1 hypothetical protein [bacterium]